MHKAQDLPVSATVNCTVHVYNINTQLKAFF